MKENSHPDLSFITLNYNGLADTVELLQSIYSTVTSITFEVIVVDNSSSDIYELNAIKNQFPSVIGIQSTENRGFAGGNNLGIDSASGNYIMLINNDTLIREDHFDKLLSRFENHPEIGAVSPKIVFFNPPDTIQFAGYTPLSPITLRNSLIGFMQKENGSFNQASPTPYCHGAAMIVPKKVIKEVGTMTEKYFLYYEELDWSLAIARKGYQLWYDPSQSIIHKESATIGGDSETKAYYMARNRLLFAYRNIKSFQMPISIIYQLLISIPKRVFVYLLNGKILNAKATLKGTFSFFRIKNKKL